MNDTIPGEDNGHADNIVEVQSYEAPLPPIQSKAKFLPWHRPRKQYVRHQQWCEEILQMIQDTAPSDGILKYLGLPGVDLLDLRYFHSEVCTKQNVKLRFLGFNTDAKPQSAAQTELNISLDEVKRLPFVHHLSEVIGDNFSKLADQKSVAFQKATELGPYDVINLDLCDGFGIHPPGALANTYYAAVASLMSLQARSSKPWLLLLTTRTDSPNINTELLQRLVNKYCSNLEECDAFKDASRRKFGIETKEAVGEATGHSEGLLRVFLTGICKWFLNLALEQKPPTIVELRNAYGYRVVTTAQHEDLVSLALRFTPTVLPTVDPLGIANHKHVPPDEGILATKALRTIAQRIDADALLKSDHILLQNMIESTAELLQQARYDPDKYREWAATA